MTVEISPPGSGYVQSNPSLIDCPDACVRPWDPGRTGRDMRTSDGSPAPSCPGTGSCTLMTDGFVTVTAKFGGSYRPPVAPPAPLPPEL